MTLKKYCEVAIDEMGLILFITLIASMATAAASILILIATILCQS